MKLKTTLIYGEDLCEMLKESFGCSTDQELLVVVKAMLKTSTAKEAIDPEDLDIMCELIE